MYQKKRTRIYEIMMSAGLFIVAFRLVFAFLVTDLYHILKYGYEAYRFALNCTRPDVWIRPALFMICGACLLMRKRKLQIAAALLLLMYYLTRYHPTSYLLWNMSFHLETVACVGLLAAALLDCFGFLEWCIDWRLFTVSETLSLLLAVQDAFNSTHLSSMVSCFVWLLYKIPLLAVLIISRKIYGKER